MRPFFLLSPIFPGSSITEHELLFRAVPHPRPLPLLPLPPPPNSSRRRPPPHHLRRIPALRPLAPLQTLDRRPHSLGMGRSRPRWIQGGGRTEEGDGEGREGSEDAVLLAVRAAVGVDYWGFTHWVFGGVGSGRRWRSGRCWRLRSRWRRSWRGRRRRRKERRAVVPTASSRSRLVQRGDRDPRDCDARGGECRRGGGRGGE